ncbi:MAG: hypothetical protein HKN88_08445 [Gammaproteobacteria bacterium]|nr:aspartyl protease family protein [Gammaproteobacteria bacterium]NNC98090.1 hypothetical protein [Gammaproteobacteria bacterium]NNM13154.1 hypothetical protein [Gammaproteobacteria bacterium]
MALKKLIITILLLATSNVYAGSTDWLEFEIYNGLMLIDVEIAGIPTKAMLDTGASIVGIDIDFLEKNKINYKKGRKIILQGIFGEKRTKLIKEIDVSLYDVNFPLKNVVPINSGDAYQMIIGLPFFKDMIFQIDYPNSRFKMITRDSVDMKQVANVEMQHGNNKRSLVITANLEDGENLDLLFDTGSSSGLYLERKFAARRGWIEKYSKASGETSGIVETIENEILVLPKLKLGPYTLENVIVTVPAQDRPTNISSQASRAELGTRLSKGVSTIGILGYDVLKHFVITLDARTARMHVYAAE